MKNIILCLIILFCGELLFSQKIILHRNSGGNQILYSSSIDSITFLPFVCGDEIRYEGKTYNTVLIGEQCWLKENLDVGTMITGGQNQSNNDILEKWCYNNSEDSCTKYGGLYHWNEAMQYSETLGAKGICPTGWHIPTAPEYQTLATNVENNSNSLKAIGQGTGSGIGTDVSGFSGLLAGGKWYDNSGFIAIGGWGSFWISQVGYSSIYAYSMRLENNNTTIFISDGSREEWGFSVRCIKN